MSLEETVLVEREYDFSRMSEKGYDKADDESDLEEEEEDMIRNEYEGKSNMTSESESENEDTGDDLENTGPLMLNSAGSDLRSTTYEGSEPNFLSDSDIEVTHDAALRNPLSYDIMDSEDEKDQQLLTEMINRKKKKCSNMFDLFSLQAGDSLYFLNSATLGGEYDYVDDESKIRDNDDDNDQDGDESDGDNDDIESNDRSPHFEYYYNIDSLNSASGSDYSVTEHDEEEWTSASGEDTEDEWMTEESIEYASPADGNTTDSLDSDDHEGLARFGIEVDSDATDTDAPDMGLPTASMYELQAPTSFELMQLSSGPSYDKGGHDTDGTVSDNEKGAAHGQSYQNPSTSTSTIAGRRGNENLTKKEVNPMDHSLRYGILPINPSTPNSNNLGSHKDLSISPLLTQSLGIGIGGIGKVPSTPSRFTESATMSSPTMGVFSSAIPGGLKRSRTLVIDPSNKLLPPSPFPRARARTNKRLRTENIVKGMEKRRSISESFGRYNKSADHLHGHARSVNQSSSAGVDSHNSSGSGQRSKEDGDMSDLDLNEVLNPWVFITGGSRSDSRSDSESESENEEDIRYARRSLSKWQQVPMGAFRSAGRLPALCAERGPQLDHALRPGAAHQITPGSSGASKQRRHNGRDRDLFTISPVLLPRRH